MASLTQQRCFNHALREAAARCLECGHFYCRECVTEHDERVICAACLKKVTLTPFARRRSLVGLIRGVQFLAGLFMVWLFFYWLGEILLSVSSSFHDASVWRGKWLGAP